jgi:heme-degrading monooxygenase HmoA
MKHILKGLRRIIEKTSGSNAVSHTASIAPTIIGFESQQALEAWRNHPEHLQAQALGRERFYAEYHLQVCEPIRAYSFQDGVRVDQSRSATEGGSV